jgi:predicted TIM-barrel fold metal-dependent hydrolase
MRYPGWIGVKCHPFWHNYAVEALAPVAEWCQEHQKPLLLHLGGNRENGNFRYLTRRFSHLRIIFAHAGVPWYRELWEHIRGRAHLSIDLSSPYLNEPLRREAVRFLGCEQCLYGTDGPYGYLGSDGGYDHGAILGEIERLGLSAQETALIKGGNFLRMLDLCVAPSP